jgi:hypothetical protein
VSHFVFLSTLTVALALQLTSSVGWTIGRLKFIVSQATVALNGKAVSRICQIMANFAEQVTSTSSDSVLIVPFSPTGEPSPLLRVVEAWCRSSKKGASEDAERVDQDRSSDN